MNILNIFIEKIWVSISKVSVRIKAENYICSPRDSWNDGQKKLFEKVDLTLANLSILKTGKAKDIRFSTLESICKALDCQPGDLLEYTIS